MTATSVVSIERRDNVTYISFGTDSTHPEPVPGETGWWPWMEGADEVLSGKTPTATGPLPARWSPRPVRVLRRRFARSQFAADLRQWAWLVGVLSAAVLVLVAGDYLNRLLGGLS